MKVHPFFLVCIASVLAGVLNLFSKDLLLAGLSPIQICLCREGVTAIAFGLILLFIDRPAFKVKIRDLWLFILFALFNVISNLAVFTAQDMIPLGMAAVLEMTSPFFVVVIAFFMFGNKITKNKILALALAFLGCILITGVVTSPDGIQPMGILIGLLSGVTLAAFTLGSKCMEGKGYSENTVMFYFFLFSTLLVLPFTGMGEIFDAIQRNWIVLPCILCMGMMCTLLINYIVIYATRRMDPGVVAIVITSSIIVSTLCGVLVFGDAFGWKDIIGMIMIIVAVAILEPPKFVKKRFGMDTDENDKDTE